MREKRIKNNIPESAFNAHTELILKNIDEVIYFVTIDKKNKKEIVFLSDKIEDILGISKKKYLQLGKKIINYCHKEDVDGIYKNITQLLKRKVKGTFRYRFYNPKQKKYIWVEETIYPQIDKAKKLTGYFGVSRNIEQEKQFEERIIDSERKFRLLAENSSDIIFHYQFKPQPEYTYVSPSVHSILGYRPEDFYKDPMIGFKMIHPSDRDQLLSSQQNIVKGKPILKTFNKLTARYITKNKRIIWLENRYSPIYEKKQIVALQCVSRDITDQKIKEEERDNTRTQLANLLSNLPGIAYRCLNDKQWTMQFISTGVKELTGYLPEDFINNKKRSFASIIHPEDRGVGTKDIRNALKNKRSFEIEYRIIAKDGGSRWIWEKGAGIYSDKGKLLYIEGFINDISERKQAEQELNQRWLNYQNLLDTMPTGVFIHVNGKVRFGNKAAYEIAEIGKKDDIEKFSLLDFLRPEDKATGIERISRAMNGEDTPFIEYHIVTKNGTQKVIRTKSSPITYNGARAVQIIVQDITKEKKLEEERIKARIAEQTNKELQNEIKLRNESEQKLKAIFESTSHLIWTINKNLEIVSFNRQYHDSIKKLCGIDVRPGTKTTALSQVFSPADYETLRAAHTNAFMGKDTRIEIPLNGVDGKVYYREMHFYPITIDGRINEIAAVAQDTTERRSYEKRIIEQSSKLTAVFESGTQRIWTVDKNYTFTSFNSNFADSYKNALGKTPQIGGPAMQGVKGTPAHDFWKEKYDQVFLGKSIEFESVYRMINGKTLYTQVFFHPIYNEKKEVVEVAGLSQDITDRKNAEKQIMEQTARMHAIFKSGPQLMWTVDKELRLTSFNKNYANAIFELYGVYPETNTDVARLSEKMRSEEYNGFWSGKYEEALSGKSLEFDTERTTRAGKKIYRHIFLHPIYDEVGGVTEVSAIGYDITEQKAAQEIILNKQSELEAIINTTSDIILSLDTNYCIIEFNNVMREIAEWRTGRKIIPGKSFFEYLPEEMVPLLKKTYDRALSGESVSATEHFVHPKTGLERIYEANYNPIYVNNKIKGIAIFSRDVTEQKKSEEETLKSLKEKEVLLKEVHHRVKNNLQVISSILNLQTAYLKDRSTINLLKECQNRIKTMAFIHESLYQNKDFSQINFSEYIVNLVKNLFYSFETNQQKIKTNFAVEPIFLNLDLSIPCGLIVNELVSNALKYAFDDGREGAVFITLKKHRDKIKIVVADNGRGIPDSIDFRNTETLGLQLVSTLTEQINGTITMNRNKGTTFEIIF